MLGKANAPVTIVEYADFQCPYCAQWAVDSFPAIVNEYVRPGKVRVVYDGVAFLGPDSLTALQTAFAAGRAEPALERERARSSTIRVPRTPAG